MITVKYGKKMSINELNVALQAIANTKEPLQYEVTEIDLHTIVCSGGYGGLNEFLIDNIINNGYLFGEVEYKFGKMENEKVSIIVTICNYSEYIENLHEE